VGLCGNEEMGNEEMGNEEKRNEEKRNEEEGNENGHCLCNDRSICGKNSMRED